MDIEPREIICQFQQLANEYFFTISPYTLQDALSSFARLTNQLNLPEFVNVISRCQRTLLISSDDVETLVNLLIQNLSEDQPEVISLAAALLPRVISMLEPEQQSDAICDLCTALDVFVAAAAVKPTVIMIIAVVSALDVLGPELQ